MEKYPDLSDRQKAYRRVILFFIVSLVVLFATALLRLLTVEGVSGRMSVGVPVGNAVEWTRFLDKHGIDFRSAEKLEVCLDHYNPEILTVAELQSRFLPGDDRMTPFLAALPGLFDIEENGITYRMFFPEAPLPRAVTDEWEKNYPDAELLIQNGKTVSVAYRVFFYTASAVCFALTLVVRRKERKNWWFPVTVFAAVLLSGSVAALWAAVLIVNTFLSLWRKWSPHREYREATGIDTVSRRDKLFIAGETVAAVTGALLPALLLPGERIVAVTAVAMGAAGLSGSAVFARRRQIRSSQPHLVLRPLLGSAFRRPWKSAVAELLLGAALLILPGGYTVFSRLPAGFSGADTDGFRIAGASYSEIYAQTQRQPRGTVNAVGYIEEKVFQYCYRYRKLPRLPEPGTEIFIPEYYYQDGVIRAEKKVAGIFTERGFDSIIKKSESDPLSVYFLSEPEMTGRKISPGICLLWTVLTVFYFGLLMPFFRIPSRRLRFINIKEKV